MALILSGDTGPSFNQSAAMPTGSVLQVVQATYTPTVTTSSTSYVTSNITASITPKFATSKILVIASIPFQSTASAQGCLTIFRNNTTDIASSARGFGEQYGTSEIQAIAGINFLDSPATTSSTAYTIYFRSINGGTMRTCIDNCQAVITLQEIAG
jgi:hypothetical protein